MHALCEQWARELPHFRYVPVISDRPAGRRLDGPHAASSTPP